MQVTISVRDDIPSPPSFLRTWDDVTINDVNADVVIYSALAIDKDGGIRYNINNQQELFQINDVTGDVTWSRNVSEEENISRVYFLDSEHFLFSDFQDYLVRYVSGWSDRQLKDTAPCGHLL